jgi:hypothetical protein
VAPSIVTCQRAWAPWSPARGDDPPKSDDRDGRSENGASVRPLGRPKQSPLPRSPAQPGWGRALRRCRDWLQCVDRCSRNDASGRSDQALVQGDEGIRLQLGESQVLGIEGARRAELIRDLPRDAVEHAIAQQPQSQCTHVIELPLCIPLRDLSIPDRLVEAREKLGTDKSGASS